MVARIESARIYSTLASTEKIAPGTKKQYADRLRQIQSICEPLDMHDIFMDPERTYSRLLLSTSKISTRGAMANALGVMLSVIKHVFTNGEMSEELKERWTALHKRVQGAASNDFISGETKTDLKWIRVYDKNIELYNAAMSTSAKIKDVSNALLSSIYTDLEPRRHEDYLRLYIKTSDAPSLETSYIDMTLPKPKIYNEMYKTVKSHKVWSKELPDRFLQLLKKSLDMQPRDYVFVGSDGLPYNTASAWAQHHNGRLRKWFGPKTNVLSLRHARSTSLNEDARYSLKERMDIGHDMGHKFVTSFAYFQKKDTTPEDKAGAYKTARYSEALEDFVEYKCIPIPKSPKKLL